MSLTFLRSSLVVAASLLVTSSAASAAQFSIGIEHDLSKPTYGLQGPTSSQVKYDERNGLNLKGTINDILGPPVKIASGFGNMIEGSKLAGLGSSLKSGGALLGVDAKLLEAAGGAHLLKGGLLLGGATAKTGAAALMGGPVGKKVASIVEFPVKVVALKDIAAGKTLAGMGKVKMAEAVATKAKGTAMINKGEGLKKQGFNQVIQGAQEGMQNIGNMVQQTTENMATAYKLLPIVLDLPMTQQQEQTQQTVDPTKSATSQQHLGGSNPLFGGLSSIIPGLGSSDPFSLGAHQGNNHQFNLFGPQGHNGYAALLDTAHPFANLLMNQNLNPFLQPLAGGPLGQSVQSKLQTPGGGVALGLGEQRLNYNLFPGLKISETSSSHLPEQAVLSSKTPVAQTQQEQLQTTKN